MAKPQQKQLTLYADLMEELKIRFDCVNHAAHGRTGLPAPIIREFLYQQLRFVCELVAVSCLVAHDDIRALKSHKIGRAYSADEILDKMTALRPHFCPNAVRETKVESLPGGKRNHFIEGVNPSPLAREDLIALYAKTHKRLHRGSLKALLSAATPFDMTLDVPAINEVMSNFQKFSNLLSHHLIAISEDTLIVCLLKNPQDNNRVQVITTDRIGPVSLLNFLGPAPAGSG
jgi:hypothetical protein